MDEKKKHGGSRKGAGRKNSGGTVNMKVTVRANELLEIEANKTSISKRKIASKIIEDALENKESDQ